jgi:hypothetical protein
MYSRLHTLKEVGIDVKSVVLRFLPLVSGFCGTLSFGRKEQAEPDGSGDRSLTSTAVGNLLRRFESSPSLAN